MFSKKKYLFLPVSLSIFIFIYFVLINPNRTRKVETFLREFPRKEFFSKMHGKHPLWMKNQIDDDFKDFEKNSITKYTIDKTFEKIQKDASDQKELFIRYRIINNKLYRYYPKGQEITKREPSFEKAIKTLTKLTDLPDIDFICSDKDGTPEFYMKDDFYITDDIKDQAPLFSRAKIKSAKYVSLIPDYYSVSIAWEKDCLKMLDSMKQIPWEKKFSQAFWRGGSHDKGYDQGFRQRPRVIISELSKNHPDLIEAGINLTDYMQYKEVLTKEGLIKPHASIEDHLNYKYLPVLDGYMCTYPGYQWRLLSNSVCFKQDSNEVQWFYSALKPYEHYIPINNDMSNLVDQIKWSRNFDSLCKQIANNATSFVLNNLMLEDVYLYLYKTLISYSSYLSIDKKELIKDTKLDPNWVCIQQRRKANKNLLKRKKHEEALR